jgi:hypothetical protein
MKWMNETIIGDMMTDDKLELIIMKNLGIPLFGGLKPDDYSKEYSVSCLQVKEAIEAAYKLGFDDGYSRCYHNTLVGGNDD